MTRTALGRSGGPGSGAWVDEPWIPSSTATNSCHD